MTATSIQVIAIAFPNPEWSYGGDSFDQISTDLSYSYLNSYQLTTLSTNSASPGQAVAGLLYTPDLPTSNNNGDGCREAVEPWVPVNATRRANLPAEENYELVAVAPWISPECTQHYLDSAREDPVTGFVFFLPDNSTTVLPEQDSSQWSLGDGEDWKRSSPFPVYAVPGAHGRQLLLASGRYSGNMTEVPHGHELTELYDSRDYVRLFVSIDTGGGASLPSLWIFLLVVLGILLTIIGVTSLIMHWLQRRRRLALRRRVANGEVDLEALGIKRLTVPQEVLDEMPLYTYGSGAPVASSSVARAKTTKSAPAERLSETSTPLPQPSATAHHPTSLNQPTCAICLDDYVPASSPGSTQGTIVRELPCQHIFHPECVDTFLRDSSSLCPMCKKTALPKGYCPRVITNAMVRRERMVRRMRPRDSEAGLVGTTARQESIIIPHGRSIQRDPRPTRFGSVQLDRLWQSGGGSGGGGRRISSAPPIRTASQQNMTEMTPPTAAALARSNTTVSSSQQPTNGGGPPVQPPSTARRREWARERAVAMLGRNVAPVDPEGEEARRTPRWRKAVRGLFPGR